MVSVSSCALAMASLPVFRSCAIVQVIDPPRDAALAPAFGCELMEEEEKTYNHYGLPTSYRHFRVTHYIPEEPDTALLTLPSGYSITERRY
jgi:hypothetical protein